MKHELRAYTRNGNKVFLPFDLKKFLKAMNAAKDFGNATLEHALSIATNNTDDAGNKHRYLTLEWLNRDHKTGLTKP